MTLKLRTRFNGTITVYTEELRRAERSSLPYIRTVSGSNYHKDNVKHDWRKP